MTNKDLFIEYAKNQYEELYEKEDDKLANKYSKLLIDLSENMLLEKQENVLLDLLSHEHDAVKYQAACVVISIYPKESIKVLKNLIKHSPLLIKTECKYALLSYESGDNYYENFLKTSLKNEK